MMSENDIFAGKGFSSTLLLINGMDLNLLARNDGKGGNSCQNISSAKDDCGHKIIYIVDDILISMEKKEKKYH